GELGDVLVVLADPRAQLVPAQLALHPLLGERGQAAVPGADGLLEPGAELARGGAHDDLLPSDGPGARNLTGRPERVKGGRVPDSAGSPPGGLARPPGMI